jgi:hypothetical protein
MFGCKHILFLAEIAAQINKLVSDRAARAPLSPWPQARPALNALLAEALAAGRYPS